MSNLQSTWLYKTLVEILLTR